MCKYKKMSGKNWDANRRKNVSFSRNLLCCTVYSDFFIYSFENDIFYLFRL